MVSEADKSPEFDINERHWQNACGWCRLKKENLAENTQKEYWWSKKGGIDIFLAMKTDFLFFLSDRDGADFGGTESYETKNGFNGNSAQVFYLRYFNVYLLLSPRSISNKLEHGP